MTLDDSLYPNPQVVETELDPGETVLLHLEHSTYFTLNSTGTCIWQGLKQGLSLREVSQRLQHRFTVEAEDADRSVMTLVQELAAHKLVDSRTQ
jgi:hypothetical protein